MCAGTRQAIVAAMRWGSAAPCTRDTARDSKAHRAGRRCGHLLARRGQAARSRSVSVRAICSRRPARCVADTDSFRPRARANPGNRLATHGGDDPAAMVARGAGRTGRGPSGAPASSGPGVGKSPDHRVRRAGGSHSADRRPRTSARGHSRRYDRGRKLRGDRPAVRCKASSTKCSAAIIRPRCAPPRKSAPDTASPAWPTPWAGRPCNGASRARRNHRLARAHIGSRRRVPALGADAGGASCAPAHGRLPGRQARRCLPRPGASQTRRPGSRGPP